jgi:aryl-alcohol dehydrogenase-like predicted oxidoreductase
MGEVSPFMTCPAAAFGKPTSRLGLASHGSTGITPDDVLHAVERGVSFFNWAGLAEGDPGPDAFSKAISSLGRRRESVVVCVQFGSRTAGEARDELRAVLGALGTDYVDVVTLYYVESAGEWERLRAPGGALEVCRAAKKAGTIRRIGVTSHQRPLAAEMARSGELDALMIRYNAAHRGAEREVFPVTTALGVPVIAYTALRWGALLAGTPEDPAAFRPAPAASWYRFVLQNPAASVVLCAPHDRRELDADLAVLDATGPLEDGEYARLAEHGLRVRAHAGHFG